MPSARSSAFATRVSLQSLFSAIICGLFTHLLFFSSKGRRRKFVGLRAPQRRTPPRFCLRPLWGSGGPVVERSDQVSSGPTGSPPRAAAKTVDSVQATKCVNSYKLFEYSCGFSHQRFCCSSETENLPDKNRKSVKISSGIKVKTISLGVKSC